MKTCNECRVHNTIHNPKNRCEHGNYKYQCYKCRGSSICKHGKFKAFCRECNFINYLFFIVSARMYDYTGSRRKGEVIKHNDLGCGIEQFKQHIEAI